MFPAGPRPRRIFKDTDGMPERMSKICQKVRLIECQIECQNQYSIHTSRWYVKSYDSYVRIMFHSGDHSKKVNLECQILALVLAGQILMYDQSIHPTWANFSDLSTRSVIYFAMVGLGDQPKKETCFRFESCYNRPIILRSAPLLPLVQEF